MISIKVLVNSKGNILGFEIFGHSGYEEIGKDIVCSAVSSATYMVINTLLDVLNIEFENLTVKDEGAYLYFRINEKDLCVCKYIMVGLKCHFLNLEEQYCENIKVSYVEVQDSDKD